MRKDIHPASYPTVFKDASCDFAFLGSTTAKSNETIQWEDGKTYQLIKVEVSTASHPFFNHQTRLTAKEGRSEQFKKKYAGFYGA